MLLQTLGISSSLGGPEYHCGFAAERIRSEYLRESNADFQLKWQMLYPDSIGSADEQLIKLIREHSLCASNYLNSGYPFVVIGGDHSCALGTWSGILNTMEQPNKLGLIWLDAHLDAHSFSSSPSGNVHGMPVAALLGQADNRLASFYPSNFYIQAEHLVIIGARSYEDEEYQLLNQLNVNMTFSYQINDLTQLLSTMVDQLTQSCQYIGISIDIDVIDPIDAPGVETPVKDGICANELIKAISFISSHHNICALEISEYNPAKDVNNKTLNIIKRLLHAFVHQP